MNIRRYTYKDFETVQSWATGYDVGVFQPSMFPPSTYIVESEGKAMAMLSLITTNSDRAYLEYALGNPEAEGHARRFCFTKLVQYMEDLAKGLGYDKVVCLAPNEALSDYYSTFGYSPNRPGLTLMVKEIR